MHNRTSGYAFFIFIHFDKMEVRRSFNSGEHLLRLKLSGDFKKLKFLRIRGAEVLTFCIAVVSFVFPFVTKVARNGTKRQNA